MNRNPAVSRYLLPLLSVILLSLAACTGSADDAGEFVASDPGVGAATTTIVADQVEAGEAPADRDVADEISLTNGPQQAIQAQQVARQIIFTGEMTVGVTDVADAASRARSAISGIGGFVFGETTVGLPVPRTTLVFKVDPDDFQTALALLAELGEVRSQQVSADDVTERVVDLESRITTAQASVERLRELIGEATNVEVLAQLESQLLDRETQLETLRGSLRTLRDQVALATITVTLTEALSQPGLQVDITGYPGDNDDGQSCPGDLDLFVEQGQPATVCFTLTNTGDTPLTGFELTDTVLEVELGDLIVVFGDPSGTLEPGQSIILATVTTPERDFRTLTRVSATPVNQEGTPVEARAVAATQALFVNTFEPEGLPGFGDAVSAGVDTLQDIGGLLLIGVGFVLPLLPVLVIALAAFLWWRRRRAIQVARVSVAAGVPVSASDGVYGTGSDEAE